MQVSITLRWQRLLLCALVAGLIDAVLLPLASQMYPKDIDFQYKYAPLAYGMIGLAVSSVCAKGRDAASAGAALVLARRT